MNKLKFVILFVYNTQLKKLNASFGHWLSADYLFISFTDKIVTILQSPSRSFMNLITIIYEDG